MRAFVTLLLAFVSLSLYGNNPTFNCLAEVNKCWHEQNDISPDLFPTSPPRSARAVIQLHLSLVETILRQRSTDHLSDQQRENRAACLDLLHQYWQAGRFPINEDYTCRTPIFIDRRDNFCAVGYLVKRSGHEATARKIAAATNLAYVREMHFPELNIWAHDHGFTIDELA